MANDNSEYENIYIQQWDEKEFVLLLISLYRDAPELWKANSQEYHDKSKKASAITRITNALRDLNPMYTEDELKRKINILRTNFKRELKKMNLSIMSAAGTQEILYVPKLWYFNEMMFLADLVDTEDWINPQDAQEASMNDGGPRPVRQISRKSKTKAKSRDNRQLKIMSVASSYFNKPEDEDEIVAKGWAIQLKKISEPQKLFAKKIINDVLFEAQMGTLTRSGVCFLPNDAPSINSSST